MPQAAVRFGVIGAGGLRAGTWKCWAEIGKGKSDVFVACRVLGGVVKASLHESGSWHVAYDRTGFPKMFDEDNTPPTRFIRKWTRPAELFPGATLAVRVVVPWHSPTIPEPTPEPDVTWVPTAPRGKAIEFAVILTAKGKLYTNGDWPGRVHEYRIGGELGSRFGRVRLGRV